MLPIASGGTLAHYGVIDHALKPVLAALGATYTLPGLFVLDTDLKSAEAGADSAPKSCCGWRVRGSRSVGCMA